MITQRRTAGCAPTGAATACWVAAAAIGLSPGAWAQTVPEKLAAELYDGRSAQEVYGPDYRLSPNGGYRDAAGRVPVALGVRLIQLSDIDSKEETFTVEGVLYVSWSDDWGPSARGWSEEAVDRQLKSVAFRPVPEFENGLGTRKRYSLLMAYDARLKRIEYEERFSMSFANELDFRKFPFDDQVLSIKLIIAGGKEKLVDLRVSEFTHSVIDEAEWFTSEDSYSSRIEHNVVPYDIDLPEVTKDDLFPRARFDIRISRRSGFYVWRVLMPLFLITAVSWAMFWMERGNLGERLSVCFTALLTVVAYNLILGDLLPRIAYPTFVDALITMTYLCLSMAVLESVVVASFESSETCRPRAKRIDDLAKVLFPSAYSISLAVVGVIFL